MAYTFDEKIFSDLHKDAYGFRPRGHEFYTASNDRKQQIWDQTVDALSREMEYERQREAAAQAELERRIAECGQLGAPDVETAIRWIIEAEDFDDFDLRYGVDYFAYHFGLNYQFGLRRLVELVIRQMTNKGDV